MEVRSYQSTMDKSGAIGCEIQQRRNCGPCSPLLDLRLMSRQMAFKIVPCSIVCCATTSPRPAVACIAAHTYAEINKKVSIRSGQRFGASRRISSGKYGYQFRVTTPLDSASFAALRTLSPLFRTVFAWATHTQCWRRRTLAQVTGSSKSVGPFRPRRGGQGSGRKTAPCGPWDRRHWFQFRRRRQGPTEQP